MLHSGFVIIFVLQTLSTIIKIRIVGQFKFNNTDIHVTYY